MDSLPSREQLALYVWIPATMVLCGFVLVVVGRKISTWLFSAILFVLIVALLPVVLLFGGGL